MKKYEIPIKKEGLDEVLQVKVRSDTAEQVKKLSKKYQVKVSALLRFVVEKYVHEQEKFQMKRK